ncbi:MAG: tetratricopeptide repeat protein [Desulfobacterales bacterium]|nr:tetratricopeptide repeat protein [Desulfobacterales bacterium]
MRKFSEKIDDLKDFIQNAKNNFALVTYDTLRMQKSVFEHLKDMNEYYEVIDFIDFNQQNFSGAFKSKLSEKVTSYLLINIHKRILNDKEKWNEWTDLLNISRESLGDGVRNIIFIVNQQSDDLLYYNAKDLYSWFVFRLSFSEKEDYPDYYLILNEIKCASDKIFFKEMQYEVHVPLDELRSQEKELLSLHKMYSESEKSERDISIDIFLPLADIKYKMSNYHEAIQLYDKGLKYLSDTKTKLDIYYNKADILWILGESDKATDLLKQGIDIAKETENKQKQGKLKSQLGAIYHKNGYYDKSLEVSLETIKISKEVGDKKTLALSYNTMGNHYNQKRDYKTSIEYYNESLKIGREINDKYIMTFPISNIGNTLFCIKEYDSALVYLNKALELSKEEGDKKGIIYCLQRIGDIKAFGKNNYDSALEDYQKSLEISKEIDDKSSISRSMQNIGLLHYSKANYTSFISHYKEALSIEEEIGRKSGVSHVHTTIGLYFIGKNDDKAIEHLKKSIDINEHLGDKQNVADTTHWFAFAYKNKGDTDTALVYYKKTLLIREKLGNIKNITDTLNSIANIYRSKNDTDNAITYYNKLISAYEQTESETDNNLDEKICYKGEYDPDIANILTYLKDKEKEEREQSKDAVKNAIDDVAGLYRTKREFNNAIELYEKYCTKSKDEGNKDDIEYYRTKIEMLLKEKGDYDSLASFRWKEPPVILLDYDVFKIEQKQFAFYKSQVSGSGLSPTPNRWENSR